MRMSGIVKGMLSAVVGLGLAGVAGAQSTIRIDGSSTVYPITEAVAERDKVVVWYTVQGTQTGEFEGIRATGKQVRWYGADLFRIENGKIVECRFVDDSLGLLRQLGATVSPPN